MLVEVTHGATRPLVKDGVNTVGVVPNSGGTTPTEWRTHLEQQQQEIYTNEKRLTEDTMSPRLKRMEYAVRGTVVIAADKINDELQKARRSSSSSRKYPFDKIVYTNIGNPQSVGQKPLTWPRQVLALVDLPNEVGIDHPQAARLFPADAIRRAREIKTGLGGSGSTGAYSHSKGVKCFRQDVAAFIEHRDGINKDQEELRVDPEDIYLTNGASAGIGMILQALIADETWYVHCDERTRRRRACIVPSLPYTPNLLVSSFFMFFQRCHDPHSPVSYLQRHVGFVGWSKGGILLGRRE